ncbi:MAG: peptidase U61 LD-carboxypeptidase A [Acidobacteria bacterium OLB17]|nr:MAG: peptidase U61 LD-carboxypeptidase A [Acidobacteria bacterium OLB17]MCZ2390345.1 LD-carboxypeptidase [Acidobacteriota bacterium]
MIKPKALKKGDKVAVVAPASGVSKESFDRALENLSSLGFDPKAAAHARGQKGFLSGTDAERLVDLHDSFADKSVKAVWCVRGGGGCPRLLPSLDFDLIRKNPKVFIGFSDITALHVAISQRTGLVTFHGPVGTSNYTDYTRGHVLELLMNTARPPIVIEPSPENLKKEATLFHPATIKGGRATGELTGGNLALLASLCGTPDTLKNIAGKILFIEDINEPPYRVDRMLTQLRQSLDLRSAAGFALGVFEDGANASKAAAPLLDVFRDRLGDLGVPVVSGLSFGHIAENMTLPYGIKAELDADKATLTLLESAVS